MERVASDVMDTRYFQARLPPELKQEHGDGVIMYGDSMYDVCDEQSFEALEEFEEKLRQVHTLGDGKPPIVPRWDDALPWVQRKADALELTPDYYTLVFCIITESLLKRRDYADALLISFIEDISKKNKFVPVYQSRNEMKRLKNEHDGSQIKLLPGLFNIHNPLFLDGANGVSTLMSLLNAHLNEKMARQDEQRRDTEQEVRRLRRELGILPDDADVADSGPSVELDTSTHNSGTCQINELLYYQ